MSMPTQLAMTDGALIGVTSITIDRAEFYDVEGRAVPWEPGDLCVIWFDRPDVVAASGWTTVHGAGQTACYRWIAAADARTAEFHVPTATETTWRGFGVRGVEPAPAVES